MTDMLIFAMLDIFRIDKDGFWIGTAGNDTEVRNVVAQRPSRSKKDFVLLDFKTGS
jgi:hypothetical protein